MPNPSYAHDIHPLFRQKDIDSMKRFGGFDLSKVADVRAKSKLIYQRLSAEEMPCDGPWNKQQLALFKSWMDSGMAD